MKRIPIQKEKSVKAEWAPRGARLWRYGVPLFFFSCYFIFLLRFIDPAVIYSSNGINIHSYVAAMHAPDTTSYKDPWFRRPFILELTPEYVREIAASPGGWTRLAVTLCIYACHYPIAGALVVTGLALFFFWIFTLYIQGTGARRPLVLSFVPAFFIMTMCAWYELRSLAFLLPIAGALAFAVFYWRMRPALVLTRALWLSLLFWFAWYLMQWGSLLLLLFIVIHELFSRERRRRPAASAAAIAAVNGALVFIADAWLIPLDKTIRWGDFTEPSGLPLAVVCFFPLAAITLAAFGRFRRLPAGKVISAVVQASLLVCGTAAAAVWLLKDPVNRDTRTIARTAYHVMNGQWEAILHEKTAPLFMGFPQKADALQVFMMHAVDHALCRTGRLGDRLLAFPQVMFSDDPLLMLWSTLRSGFVNSVVALDLAMDLGMVNTAEKIAGEIMEKMGPYPDIIYRRALVQIAKGNKDAAAVYLGKLACMPFYRAEAKRLLRMLDNNSALHSEFRIALMRANMDTVDYFVFNDVSDDAILKHLLQSNPGNKAAYDYLMTYYLLTHRLEEVASFAPAAPSFGYIVLPRSWEEALCLFQAVNSMQASREVSYSGLRQETKERFGEFSRAWLQVENDPGAAEKLAAAFGDSYFYFSIFRYCRGGFH